LSNELLEEKLLASGFEEDLIDLDFDNKMKVILVL
jgi:hypothetical protein